MLTAADLRRLAPALLTEPPIVGLSTDDEPSVGSDGGALEVGQVWLKEDTGHQFYYDGSEWKPVEASQERGLQTALLFKILEKLGDD